MDRWEVGHIKSSHCHHWNVHTEAAVKSMKHLPKLEQVIMGIGKSGITKSISRVVACIGGTVIFYDQYSALVMTSLAVNSIVSVKPAFPIAQ